MKTELTNLDFTTSTQFVKRLLETDEDSMFESAHGNWKNQIIPLLYLKTNEHFETGQSLAKPGVLLNMALTKKHLYLYYELSKYLLSEDYDAAKNQVAIFLKIEWQNIIRFSQNGPVKFQGVNPRTGTKLIGQMNNLPVGGLIAKLVVFGFLKGASKISEKATDDTVEKDGTEFLLEFKHDNSIKKLLIVAESFYASDFELFLTSNWHNRISL